MALPISFFLDVKIAIKPGWISRSCRHAGTRYNARGLDDDGEVTRPAMNLRV